MPDALAPGGRVSIDSVASTAEWVEWVDGLPTHKRPRGGLSGGRAAGGGRGGGGRSGGGLDQAAGVAGGGQGVEQAAGVTGRKQDVKQSAPNALPARSGGWAGPKPAECPGSPSQTQRLPGLRTHAHAPAQP